MTAAKDSVATQQLFITHLFDAPREWVFLAWTDPEQLMQWYAPGDCTITFSTIDVRPNGHFHSCVHDPLHGDCWMRGVYREIRFPEILVFSMVLSNAAGDVLAPDETGKPGDWPVEIITTVFFTSVGQQTQI